MRKEGLVQERWQNISNRQTLCVSVPLW